MARGSTEHAQRLATDVAVAGMGVRSQIVSDGAKALLLLNGGGAAALLAWLNSSLSLGASPDQRALMPWLITATVLLIIGSLASTSSFFLRYFASAHEASKLFKRFWLAWLTSVVVSGATFALGAIVVLIGLIVSV